MKVLFVANEGQIGGATKCLFTLAKVLKESKKVDPIILISKKGFLTDMCDKENIKYIILKFDAFVIPASEISVKRLIKKMLFPLLKIRHYILNCLALNRIDKIIDMDSIDIIHTNVNRDDFGALLSRKYNIPHIWHIREFGDVDYRCLYFNKNYINFMNNNTDYFISVSNAVKNNFINKGLNKNKIITIYDGISKFVDYKKSFSKKQLKMLFMGGIQNNKGQIQLIESLHLLSKDITNNVKVDFYGSGNFTYIKELKEKISQYNLTHVFSFNDYNKDIDKIIKNYDVGIMCSKCEAFGMITIEYMSNKLITIVSNTGASPEIMGENNEFIYEYNNYQDLADLIKKIFYMSDDEKNKIISNNFKRVKKFNERETVNNIKKLYDTLLTNKGG